MPQKCPVWCKKALKNSKIRSTLRVRIEGNIENGNCYCIRIDYDDNNEEVEEKEEEEEEEEVQFGSLNQVQSPTIGPKSAGCFVII